MSRTLGAVSSETSELPEVTTTFGVSGYLRESDVLIYDRATQTIWSQIDGAGIAGPRAGTKLQLHPIVDTTWAAWKARYPDSRVLRGPKPARAYAGGYARYHQSDRVMFPISNRSDRLRNKAVVTGVTMGDGAACWSHDRLKERADERAEAERQDQLTWTEDIGGAQLTLTYDPVGDSLTATLPGEESAETVIAQRMYWFAWFTFHPTTQVDGVVDGEDAGD